MKNMKNVLLVIDVQYEYFTGKLPVTYPEDSFQNILKAIDCANKNEIPVILIQHANTPCLLLQNQRFCKHTKLGENAATFKKGSHEHDIHEEVLKKDYDLIIEKNLPGSFTGTELGSWLKKHNINTVTICGYMTQMCCDTTARQAMHMDYNVEFLSDATGTLDISNSAGKINAAELHKAILITQAMIFSKVISTNEWINGLKKE